jgi:gliding motility-associated-like protein
VIFNNDPMVYWGFSGATGGAVNVQKFCTALTPAFTTNIPGDAVCAGATVQFSDASESFAPIARYYWNFGDGTTSALPNPPPHLYAAPGKYVVRLVIEGLDGCVSDTLKKTITIGSVPAANFTVSKTCAPAVPQVQLLSSNAGVSYEWKMGSTVISTDSIPVLPAGTESGFLQLTVHSLYGCGPYASASRSFAVYKQPHIDMDVEDGCVDSILQFAAQQVDNATQVVSWRWSFGDGKTDTVQNPTHSYAVKNEYIVSAWGISSDGCSSDTVQKKVRINIAFADAGRDTLILPNVPYTLLSGGTGSFLWSPASGLNTTTTPNPVAKLLHDQVYTLTVTTPEGCVAVDSVRIEIFKGSEVHVPNAFTPNGDGLNDRFRPLVKGITRLDDFSVFNRWGELVFHSKDPQAYWDGRINGRTAPSGHYVWIFRAKDLAGKQYTLKGTILLIR